MGRFTVREIADILKVSKPTVQKVINAAGIEPDHIEKNKYRYYEIDKVKEIIKEIDPNFDFSVIENTANSIEKPQNDTENDHIFIENAAKNENNTEKLQNDENDPDVIHTMLEMLQIQLAAKDQQIAELTRLLDQQQKLTLIEKKPEGAAGSQTEEEEPAESPLPPDKAETKQPHKYTLKEKLQILFS